MTTDITQRLADACRAAIVFLQTYEYPILVPQLRDALAAYDAAREEDERATDLDLTRLAEIVGKRNRTVLSFAELDYCYEVMPALLAAARREAKMREALERLERTTERLLTRVGGSLRTEGHRSLAIDAESAVRLAREALDEKGTER